MTRYRVTNIHISLESARREAESEMASMSDDDAVYIEVEYDDGETRFFEPYGRIIRQGSRFVLKTD